MSNAGAEKKLSKEKSKAQQILVEKTKKAIRDNLVRPQIVMNRQFKGESFIAKPDKVIFRDFEVGKVYTQKVRS
jgi:hypothetical protein